MAKERGLISNQEETILQAENLAAQVAEPRDTQLTAFFKLNQSDPLARQHLYADLPQHYVFDKKARVWNPRQRQPNKVQYHDGDHKR